MCRFARLVFVEAPNGGSFLKQNMFTRWFGRKGRNWFSRITRMSNKMIMKHLASSQIGPGWCPIEEFWIPLIFSGVCSLLRISQQSQQRKNTEIQKLSCCRSHGSTSICRLKCSIFIIFVFRVDRPTRLKDVYYWSCDHHILELCPAKYSKSDRFILLWRKSNTIKQISLKNNYELNHRCHSEGFFMSGHPACRQSAQT